jgi:hypothetical protein
MCSARVALLKYVLQHANVHVLGGEPDEAAALNFVGKRHSNAGS